MFKLIFASSYVAFSASVRSSDNIRVSYTHIFEESPRETVVIRGGRTINPSTSSSMIAEPSYTRRFGVRTGNADAFSSYRDVERFSRERAEEASLIEAAIRAERDERIRRSEAESQTRFIEAAIRAERAERIRRSEAESQTGFIEAAIRAERAERIRFEAECQSLRAELSERDLTLHGLREELGSAESTTEFLVSEVREIQRIDERNNELMEEQQRSQMEVLQRNTRLQSELEDVRNRCVESTRNEQILRGQLQRCNEELAKCNAASSEAEELRNKEIIALRDEMTELKSVGFRRGEAEQAEVERLKAELRAERQATRTGFSELQVSHEAQ